MNENRNLLAHLGEWWATRKQSPATRSKWARWLPTPGNVFFSLLLIGLLILTQNVWSTSAQQNGLHAPGPSATTISYQGLLTDSAGTPLTGNYGLTFTIYDADVNGNVIWGPENHASVPVNNGLFNVGLGSLTSGGIPTNVWDGDRYLQITVGGEPLLPRELIRSVPLAGMALAVPNDAITGAQIAPNAVDTADIADSAVTLSKMSIASYYFSYSTPTLSFNGPSGLVTLDTSSCTADTWCCNGDSSICYLPVSTGDSMVEFVLEGAPSLACMLAHHEDDGPDASKGFYYATDGGNATQSGKWAARLKREGQSGVPIQNNTGYHWVCGW